jgi:hypothetical protein
MLNVLFATKFFAEFFVALPQHGEFRVQVCRLSIQALFLVCRDRRPAPSLI